MDWMSTRLLFIKCPPRQHFRENIYVCQDSSIGAVAISSVNGYPVSGRREEEHDKVLQTFSRLVADLCQQFNGDHPDDGTSAASTGNIFYRYVMNYLFL